MSETAKERVLKLAEAASKESTSEEKFLAEFQSRLDAAEQITEEQLRTELNKGVVQRVQQMETISEACPDETALTWSCIGYIITNLPQVIQLKLTLSEESRASLLRAAQTLGELTQNISDEKPGGLE